VSHGFKLCHRISRIVMGGWVAGEGWSGGEVPRSPDGVGLAAKCARFRRGSVSCTYGPVDLGGDLKYNRG